MARDGSGNYNLPAGQPVVTGTTISSTVHNALASDVASALTQSLSKDGQTTPTANLPMGSFKHTGVADGTARTHYASLGQLQDSGIWNLGSVSGTDTITASLTPAISGYVTGMEIQLVPANTNTGAVTLAVNGLTAKSILKGTGIALTAGDLVAGVPATLVYIGASGWLLTNPQNPSVGTLTASGAMTGTSFVPTGSTVPANGMYLSAANTLAWASNTTQRAVVNSNGAWTFNVPSAGVAMTVTGVAGAKTMQLNGTTNYAWLSLIDAATSQDWGILSGLSSGNFTIRNSTSATNPLTISTTGNVAIAAPSSGVALTVTGLTAAAAQSWTDGTVTMQTQFQSSNGYFGTSSNHPFTIFSNNTNRIAVAATGNVTINAPSTGNTLSLTPASGNLGLDIQGNAGTQNMARFYNTSGSDGRTLVEFRNDLTTTKQWAIGIDANGGTSKSFDIRDLTRSVIPFSIGTNGNVTIAAPSSGNALTVNSIAGNYSFLSSDGTCSFGIYTNGASGGLFGTTTNHSSTWYTNGAARVAVAAAGNVTISAPSSGVGLTVNSGVTTTVNAVSGSGGTPYAFSDGTISGWAADLGGSHHNFGTSTAHASHWYTNNLSRIVLSSAGNVTINAPTSGVALAVAGVSGTHSTTIADSAGTTGFKAGYLGIPQNSQSANYTCVLADAGKHILHPSGGGAGDTFTIPANGSVAYDVGTTITFVNADSNSVSIAITTDTLTLAGTTTTGTRTLGQNGVATAIKVDSTSWIISGSGLS